METNSKITADKIRSMTDKEWNDFRLNSWLRKRAYYAKDMPDNYLNTKESFASYIERQAKRRGKK